MERKKKREEGGKKGKIFFSFFSIAIGISVQSALIQHTFPRVWGEAQTAYADSPYGAAPVDNRTSRFIW